MKCYILRWNPNISSYTKENHSFCIKSALNGESFKFNWSIKEWETVEEGDFFILQQVGTEQDGIAAFGQFTGHPYESRSWRKDGTKLYYSDLFVWAFIDRDLCNKFSADKMGKICPEINWHGGSSGVLISAAEAEKIYLELFTQLMGNLGPNPAIAFNDFGEDDIQDRFVDFLEIMAPEFYRRFYSNHDCQCETCNKIIEPKPAVEDTTIYWKSGQNYIRHYPVNPTLKDLENYLTLNGCCSQCDIDMEDGVSYPHIENHEAITKHFNNCVTWFHDDYITDVLIQKDYVELKIHATGADTEDWENVKPCNVIIECHGVVKMKEIDPEEFKVQPLYELQTIQVDNLYKLLLNGCGGTITCRKISARVEEEEIAEEAPSGDEVCSWEKIKEYSKIALEQDEDKCAAIDLYFYSLEKTISIWCHDGLVTAGDEKKDENTYKVFDSFDELFTAEVLPGFVIADNWNNFNWIEINGYCLSEFLDECGLENYLETYTTEYLEINDITWIGVDKNDCLFACFAGGMIGNIPEFVQSRKVINENHARYFSKKMKPFTNGKIICDIDEDCPMYEDCMNFTSRGLYCFDISEEEDGSYTKVAVPAKPLKLKDLPEDIRRNFELFDSRIADIDVCKDDRIFVEDAKK